MAKRIVFVCTENANRSQMAEAFARHWGDAELQVWSAGSSASGTLGSSMIESMSRRGIDVSQQRSESLDDLPEGLFDAAVTMGCGDACPRLEAVERIDWDLRDPRDLPPREFDEIRNDIERRVRALLAKLD